MALKAVLVDTREPEGIRSLRFGGIPVAPMLLDVGDLWVTCSDESLLIIERKTVSDLLNTLRDDRLFPQLCRMRERSCWAYLVITGVMAASAEGKVIANGRETGWTWAALQGALLKVQEMGVPVINVPDDDFEKAVIRLASRERGQMVVQPARESLMLSDGWAVVAAMPGIGPERVLAIREYCATPADAISHLTDWGKYARRMDGIGDGIRRRIRQALGIEDGFYLGISVLAEFLKDEDLPF